MSQLGARIGLVEAILMASTKRQQRVNRFNMQLVTNNTTEIRPEVLNNGAVAKQKEHRYTGVTFLMHA